jgi:hypothetical protein
MFQIVTDFEECLGEWLSAFRGAIVGCSGAFGQSDG